MQIEEQYTPAQVAEIAHVTLRTVYTWISTGRIGAVKVSSKRWLISASSLARFLRGEAPVVSSAFVGPTPSPVSPSRPVGASKKGRRP